MNIKVNDEQGKFLLSRSHEQELIGSRLYDTHNDKSDHDYLVFYKALDAELDILYPIQHQFQWDDKENNTQYIFTTIPQFWRNLLSGDSTINADVVMFNSDADPYENVLNTLRTYNIIKAYLGFAKRDLRDYKQGKGKNKATHIHRGLYCAEQLLHGHLPKLETISTIPTWSFDLEDKIRLEGQLRHWCNELFNKGELTMYPKDPIDAPILDENDVKDQLVSLYIKSANTKEFHYG